MAKPYLKILNATDRWRCNCVIWARGKVPSLPYGLWTLNDKKKIINAQNPKKGNVAIMNVGGNVGHVSFVKYVGKNHLTIQEANYKSCKISERHDTAKALKIVGYFQPKK